MANRKYAALERCFTDLLDVVSAELSEGELREIRDFLDVTEFGLALQTFVDIVIEEHKHLPHRAATVCEELARLMNFTEKVDLQAVRDATKL